MFHLIVRGDGGVFCGAATCFGRVWDGGWGMGGVSVCLSINGFLRFLIRMLSQQGPVDMLDFRVADLIHEVNFERCKPLLEVLFPGESIPRILAVHIPRVTRQDELIWRLSKNGEFLVKCAYCQWLRMYTGWNGVGRGDEVWRKVWGLKLPPKLALFLWKVLHKIIPTTVVLFRRGMAGDMVCPVCG